MTRATREPTDLTEIRRNARKFAKAAVRVLRDVMKDGHAAPAVRASAAMQLLQIAYGKQMQAAPGGGSAVDDLLGSLGTEKPSVLGTVPGATENNNANKPNTGAGAGDPGA